MAVAVLPNQLQRLQNSFEIILCHPTANVALQEFIFSKCIT